MIRENLLCEICSTRPAKVACLRRRREDVIRTYVCLECANESARLYADAALDFEGILSSKGRDSSSSASSRYSCQLCGATLADVIADGRPGCCLCYQRFASETQQIVEAAQGHTYHVGKTPTR